MDLFFTTKKKDSPLKEDKHTEQREAFYSVTDALKHIFSTSMIYGDIELLLNGKTFAKINVDGRGAATYRFKTLSGIAVVAEVFYAQARRELANGSCSFVGPKFSPASVVGFKANPEKIQVRFL
jgi:hypothetical protein